MPSHYPYLLDPTVYPDYTRRPFRVPTWATFDHRTQFTCLRTLTQTEWREDIERYTREFKLGRVIWPMAHMLYLPHIDEIVAEIKKRDLFLFDLWSYVPGSSMEGIWSNITPPSGIVGYLERTLGERFLGIDNGEQDGRYIGGYATQQCPNFQQRQAQYLNFQRHFERLCNDLGNHMSALVSLCFGHYFLKEGNHGLLGAETAQALPNSQVYYAFIRGAGKQYGAPWFGNASCFNRWGYKNYEVEGATRDGDGQSACGADAGASLNLLKRLIYTHILYNSVTVGFEMGWLREDKAAPAAGGDRRFVLTPIGQIQTGAVRFVEEYGPPGTMHTPAALLLDFHSGWAMPRHLYSGSIYQVWGAMPYEAGDHLTHGVLSLIYPGYDDASYFHDERGFLAPTPFGDMVDGLLTDAPLSVLRQYGLLIVAGALQPAAETRARLLEFVQGGGELVTTAANAAGWLPGVTIAPGARPFKAGRVVRWQDGTADKELHAFALHPVDLPAGAEVLASCDRVPAVVRLKVGKGRVILLLSPFGLQTAPLVKGPIGNPVDQSLPSPYRLLVHVQRALTHALRGQQLFDVGAGLGWITCRKARGRYTLGIHNNALEPRPFRIVARHGALRAVREIALDQGEKGQVGYWPTGMGGHDGGASDARTIAGGDIRIFEVTVAEKGVTCLPRCVPPVRPRGRYLALRPAGTIQEAILVRPTFFQHFEGVKIDWQYLRTRDRPQVVREKEWLHRQQVRVLIDFSHGFNFFPGLTLVDDLPLRYEESRQATDDVFEKMVLLGAQDAIFTLHRAPENHCAGEPLHQRVIEGVRDLCRRAANHGVTLHLQADKFRWCEWGRTTAAVAALAEQVAAVNLRLALNTGHMSAAGENAAESLAAAGERLGLVLLCAPRRDLFGQTYDAHAPVAGSGIALDFLKACGTLPVVLDGTYADLDEEYRDGVAAWGKEY